MTRSLIRVSLPGFFLPRLLTLKVNSLTSPRVLEHMMKRTPTARTSAPDAPKHLKNAGTKILLLLLLFTGLPAAARAQSSKLPAPDKIVGEYLKALGGKGSLNALRDVTYEWAVEREGR